MVTSDNKNALDNFNSMLMEIKLWLDEADKEVNKENVPKDAQAYEDEVERYKVCYFIIFDYARVI